MTPEQAVRLCSRNFGVGADGVSACVPCRGVGHTCHPDKRKPLNFFPAPQFDLSAPSISALSLISCREHLVIAQSYCTFYFCLLYPGSYFQSVGCTPHCKEVRGACTDCSLRHLVFAV